MVRKWINRISKAIFISCILIAAIDFVSLYFAEKKRGIRSVGGCFTPARLGALDTEFTKKSQLLPCKPSNADV